LTIGCYTNSIWQEFWQEWGEIVLPRYVREKSGTYHYQRDYPLKLRHLCGKKTFTYPLKLSANNATAMQINKRAIEAEEAFERNKLLIANSDPDALSATDIDRAATDFLRRRGLTPGQFVKVARDPEIAKQEEEESIQLQADGYNYADAAIPEFEDIVDKYNRGEPFSSQDRVIDAAYSKLLDKAKAKPRTLASLWQEYIEYKGIDVTTREGAKAQSYWNRWISLAGDAVIGPSTMQHINEGMDAHVLAREGKVKGQSLKRELSPVAACLRLASKRHRFGWFIELPLIKDTPASERDPLEPDEQKALVKAILGVHSPIKPKYGVALLLCLQGGMMTSEIGRIVPGDLGLDEDVPHLKIVNVTKEGARKRIVPIVLGLDLIKENIEDTIQWISSTTDSAPSATLKKIMRRTLGSDTTSPHCLRHSFRINAQDAGVSILTIASIAGWSESERGVSKHLMRYGSSGISQSKMVQNLYQESLKIHQHLIGVEALDGSNVVVFKRK
jgi:integrase